jgi:cytidine deaminase
VLTRAGNVYTGATVEGPRGRAGVSALEVAVAGAVGAGDMELAAAVVVAADGRLLPPSAVERELLSGYGRGVLVVLETNPGEYEAWMVSRLLPYAGGMPGMEPREPERGTPQGLPGS